jgi:RimJ/RimL family protein N-acetyltransferase
MLIDAGLCRLRPYRRSDVAALVEIADDREVSRNLTDRFPYPYTEEAAREWIALCEAEGEPTRSFAVEVDGVLAGGVGIEIRAGEQTGSAEIGYWLGRRFWGRGVATAAVRAVLTYAFDTLGLRRIEARVFAWNPASAHILEKAGFRQEGRLRDAIVKDGERTDLLLFGLLANADGG